MNTHHHGSCLCGLVKYELEGNLDLFYLCHCRHCQKDTGSAHASNIFSSKGKLTFLTGSEHVKLFKLLPTRHARGFCDNCGSALPYQTGENVIVPAGSLDSEVTKIPDGHIFMGSKASWEKDLGAVKTFETFP